MFHPLVSNLDVQTYECPDAIVDAFAYSVGMSCTDQLARAIGHDDNYETDEMGAAASWYPLDATDRRLYAVAEQVDFCRALNYDRVALGRRGHAFLPAPYVPSTYGAAYVRSDDRGFWDVVLTDPETAAGYLAEWVAANVPTYCDACGEPMSDEECETYGDACERCAVSFFHCEPIG